MCFLQCTSCSLTLSGSIADSFFRIVSHVQTFEVLLSVLYAVHSSLTHAVRPQLLWSQKCAATCHGADCYDLCGREAAAQVSDIAALLQLPPHTLLGLLGPQALQQVQQPPQPGTQVRADAQQSGPFVSRACRS